jgi:hypothetical protein
LTISSLLYGVIPAHDQMLSSACRIQDIDAV